MATFSELVHPLSICATTTHLDIDTSLTLIYLINWGLHDVLDRAEKQQPTFASPSQ